MTVSTAARNASSARLSGERVDADHHERVAHERDDHDQTEDVVPAEAERDVDELDADRDDQRRATR